MNTKVRKGLAGLIIFFFAVMGSATYVQPVAASTTWNVGDVFVGVSNGQYKVYDNAGVFKETVSDGQGGFTTGCSFNGSLDKLYTTNFSNTKVEVYDDPSPHTLSQTIDPSVNGGTSSESIVFAGNGDFYVGHADPNADIQRFNAAGTYQQSYDVATEGRGSDWIDLAADQKTMFYTSEGRLVKRYDVSGAGSQLADFSLLPGSGIAFALRLLPPGDGTGGLLVADNLEIKRLDGAGNVVQTYDAAGEDSWFALNLDPNGTSFWSGNYGTGNFYKFNIASGAIEVGPINTATGPSTLFGICVKGELTAAQPEITLDPPTAENEAGTKHTVTATVKSGGNPVVGTQVSFSVVAGPNAGQVSDPGECTTDPNCNTDANGQTSWTYTSNGTAGTDTIEACFADEQGVKHCARAEKTWTEKVVAEGRMTGGGTVEGKAGTPNTPTEIKHGFELHCDAADVPNRLEVNWGKGNKFHLESLTSASCVDDPTIDPNPPPAGFDTYRGSGTGRYNGTTGATAKWVFTDQGEPGKNDTARLVIVDAGGNTVVDIVGTLRNGNHQAHK